MKFKCGQTVEQKQAAIKHQKENRDQEIDRLCEWHKVFAWFPTIITPGDCRWMEYIERKCKVQKGMYMVFFSRWYEDEKSYKILSKQYRGIK